MSMLAHAQPSLLRESCLSPISFFSQREATNHKMLLLLGGLQLPSDNITTNSIKSFGAAAVGKIYKIRTEKLHELRAPLLTK